MRPSLFLLSVATGIRIMYCKNDCLRDYQQEMKLRLFEEWELHRSVMVQMPTGTGKTHLLAAIVREFLCGSGRPGMDCGASSGTGGADRGDGFPLWNGEGGRKCEGDVHPVVVTKPEDCERTAGFDCY